MSGCVRLYVKRCCVGSLERTHMGEGLGLAAGLALALALWCLLAPVLNAVQVSGNLQCVFWCELGQLQ